MQKCCHSLISPKHPSAYEPDDLEIFAALTLVKAKHQTTITVRQEREGNFESWEVSLLFLEDPACSDFFRIRKTRSSDYVSPSLTFYNLISLIEHPAGLVMFKKCSSVSASS